VRAAVRCPACGPLDYNEVLTDPETTTEFCGLCGEDLAEENQTREVEAFMARRAEQGAS